jgi:hypothetical protein
VEEREAQTAAEWCCSAGIIGSGPTGQYNGRQEADAAMRAAGGEAGSRPVQPAMSDGP